MRHFRFFAALAALALPLTSAFAESATPEGANAIEQDYAACRRELAVPRGNAGVRPLFSDVILYENENRRSAD
jgi:hypothetical protein